MFDDVRNRRDEEERIRKEGRLPPGQSLTQKFPVLHYGPVPKFDASTWNLQVWGEVEQHGSWTWEQFSKLPRSKITMDIHCVTRWSKFDTVWEGVTIKTMIDEGFIKLTEDANYLIQHAEHGFTVNVSMEVALAENFLLATHFNGEPITPEHGYPLRAVVGAIPGEEGMHEPYFWKGAKWLRGLEFAEKDKLGFWEQAGYHNEAGVWEEQRFAG